MEFGFNLPTPSTYFPLREALRGARRFLSRPSKQKLPIFPSLLMSLIGGTEWGSPMRCLYLTLWFTLSRLASLIPTTHGATFDPRAHLSWSNVHFEPAGVRIILEKTKTIQCFERKLQFLVPTHQNQSICLRTQLLHLYAASPFKSPQDPVFIFPAPIPVPLTRSIVDPQFKASLAAAGLNPALYGWSSFCRGGATSGFIPAKDVESLREHGDWKSNAYARYLALPASQRAHLVRALQNMIM